MSKEIKKYLQPGKNNIVFVYLLFLGGLMFPILSFLGVVFAYVNKSNNDKVLQTHYLFAFNTFFICVVNFILSLMINFVFIFPLLHVILLSLFIIRGIFALQLLFYNLPHSNPLTFWIK